MLIQFHDILISCSIFDPKRGQRHNDASLKFGIVQYDLAQQSFGRLGCFLELVLMEDLNVTELSKLQNMNEFIFILKCQKNGHISCF